ncbi:uncharacterized protein LOC129607246 [Condylostylus longicornis]|uniref:uncharacterized protein LOC129607246 n=1 Tax=Condylostylus longicornis TaxID=2530218 RepID=UPI00244DC79B|nr:uncharacterized protein LOC129607246 [Condylostylus longicornis]
MDRNPMSPTAPPPSYDEIVNDKQTSDYANCTQSTVNNELNQKQLNSQSNESLLLSDHRCVIESRCECGRRTQISYPFQCENQQARNSIRNNESEIVGVFKTTPEIMRCPYCMKIIETKVIKKINAFTHTIALILLVFGCFCCSCIPYFLDGLKEIKHFCPDCNEFLGAYKSSYRCQRFIN